MSLEPKPGAGDAFNVDISIVPASTELLLLPIAARPFSTSQKAGT